MKKETNKNIENDSVTKLEFFKNSKELLGLIDLLAKQINLVNDKTNLLVKEILKHQKVIMIQSITIVLLGLGMIIHVLTNLK